ncbi:carboxylesterase/lipase family protein [Nocardia callitridis]|uniref:Carboxylesterase family protein n=1 Tax=Nocardia callitridis TaxID=648753 RepID=A0ABP9KVB3_9NOCA
MKRKWRVPLALMATAAIVGAAGCEATAAPEGTDDPAVVRTEGGLLRGSVREGLREFQAVPYAAPPVGALRWQNPRPAAPWQGERDATRPPPACAQGPGVALRGPAAEDCLYLNVTAPAGGADRKPVVLWIHGGAFQTGTGASMDAEPMARRGDVVVVTINYRLGMFGFFGLPGLPGSGTFGLSDQQSAMAWVRRNIAAFHGDSSNVTIAGQSSGAMSNCAHLTSPTAAGLFDKVVMQSGSCAVSWLTNFGERHKPEGRVFLPLDEVAETGRRTATDLGCVGAESTIVDCLRGLPVDKLRPVLNTFSDPAFGTPVLPSDPSAALHAGRFAPVPVLSGNTRDEATFETVYYDYPDPITEQDYDAVLSETFGARRAAVETEYPRSAYGSAALAFAAIVTDRKWACPQEHTARDLAARTTVYEYEFADPNPPSILPPPLGMPLRAYHSSDVLSLFDLVGVSATFTPEQQRLSDLMIDYWTGFARTGDPNGPDRPKWPAFRADANPPHTQALAPGRDGVARVNLAETHHCAFWSGAGQ